MKPEKILYAMNDIDGEFLNEARAAAAPHKSTRRFVVLAAAVVALMAITVTAFASEQISGWFRQYFGNQTDAPLTPGQIEFIEENEIDIVFCFSRKVYDKLPSLDKKLGDDEIKGDTSNSHRLNKCVYNAGSAERKYVSVPLSKTVAVYGLKHPSQGFSYRKYRVLLAEIIKKEGLFI